MTCKEFSNKYGIDYNTVYTSSWSISSFEGGFSREYDEDQLRQAVINDLKRRQDKTRRNLDRIESMLGKLEY